MPVSCLYKADHTAGTHLSVTEALKSWEFFFPLLKQVIKKTSDIVNTNLTIHHLKWPIYLWFCFSTEGTEARVWIQIGACNREHHPVPGRSGALQGLQPNSPLKKQPWGFRELQWVAVCRNPKHSRSTTHSSTREFKLNQWTGSIGELKPVQIQFLSQAHGKDPGTKYWGSFPVQCSSY